MPNMWFSLHYQEQQIPHNISQNARFMVWQKLVVTKNDPVKVLETVGWLNWKIMAESNDNIFWPSFRWWTYSANLFSKRTYHNFSYKLLEHEIWTRKTLDKLSWPNISLSLSKDASKINFLKYEGKVWMPSFWSETIL